MNNKLEALRKEFYHYVEVSAENASIADLEDSTVEDIADWWLAKIKEEVKKAREEVVYKVEALKKRPNYVDPTKTASVEIISFEDMAYNQALQDVLKLLK